MKFLRPGLAFLSLTLAVAAAEVWPDADALAAASYPHAATRTIELGKGHSITAKFELTEKGNGGLTFPGGGFRAYDAQPDGVTYRGYLLTCEWKDMNGDGILDLVASGFARIWNKQGDKIESEIPIQAVYAYNVEQQRFVKLHASSEIYSW